MPTTNLRQPPRFVPTLTDVVPEQTVATTSAEQVPLEPEAVPVLPLASAIGEELGQVGSAAADTNHLPLASSVEPDWSVMARDVQAKVLQRLDVGLQKRLQDVLSDTVQLHMESMYQAIREDVHHLVNAAVNEAIAQELAQLGKTKF